jgi:hypothetical protein
MKGNSPARIPRAKFNCQTPCLDFVAAGHYVGIVDDYLVLTVLARVNGPAGATNADFIVSPVEDQTAEFDESVVVLFLSQPFETTNRYFVDTNRAMVQLFIADNPATNFFQTVTSLPTPEGIAASE